MNHVMENLYILLYALYGMVIIAQVFLLLALVLAPAVLVIYLITRGKK